MSRSSSVPDIAALAEAKSKTLAERFRERLLLLTDPTTPARFSRRGWIIAASLITLLLLPLLLFPLGQDEAIFFVAGQKILRGAIHYRDIIDIKPPLIYYIYALAIAIFGNHDVSIRILDLLLQGATCWLMIALIRRQSGNDLWGAAAAIGYAISYVALSFQGTAHGESYTGLLGLSMLWLLSYRRRPAGFLLVGVLAGVLFLLKFTLGAMLVVAIVSEIAVFRERWGAALRHSAWIVAGFAVLAAAFVLYLNAFHAVHDFLLMQQFTQGYVHLRFKSSGMGFRYLLKYLPSFFSDNYSVILSLATAAGIAFTFQRSLREADSPQAKGAIVLLRFATLAFLALVATVVIEGKYTSYQFSRIYPFGLVLASFAFVRFAFRLLRGQHRDLFAWIIGGAAVVGVLLFSPITRYAWHSGVSVLRLVRGDEAYDQFYDPQGEAYTRHDLAEVGGYVQSHRRPGDRLFASSTVPGLVYRFADEVPDQKMIHSAFFIAPFAPQEWRDSLRAYLLREMPRFIITQTRDTSADVNDTTIVSSVGLRSLPGIDSLLNDRYQRVIETEWLELYERKQ
jgi:hypothetical protein